MLRYVYAVADLTGVAHRALRLSSERKKRDLDRRAGYQERDIPRIKASFERLERDYLIALGVERFVNDTHAARAQPAFDLEAIGSFEVGS